MKKQKKCKELDSAHQEALAVLIARDAARGIEEGVSRRKRVLPPPEQIDMVF